MPQKLNAAQLDNVPKSTRSSLLLGTSTSELVTPAALYSIQASTALTFSSTITLNLAAGLNWHTTATSPFTMANPTGLIAGQSGRIRIVQPASNSGPVIAISVGSYWKFPNATLPTLSTAANAVDLLVYFVHDASTIEAMLVKAVG